MQMIFANRVSSVLTLYYINHHFWGYLIKKKTKIGNTVARIGKVDIDIADNDNRVLITGQVAQIKSIQ